MKEESLGWMRYHTILDGEVTGRHHVDMVDWTGGPRTAAHYPTSYQGRGIWLVQRTVYIGL